MGILTGEDSLNWPLGKNPTEILGEILSGNLAGALGLGSGCETEFGMPCLGDSIGMPYTDAVPTGEGTPDSPWTFYTDVQLPFVPTPWYKNPCITSALRTGPLNIGIDAIGLIPEAGGIVRVFGHQAGYVGVVADQLGTKVIKKAIGGTASAVNGDANVWDISFDGAVSTSLTVAGFIPVVNDFAAVLSVGWNICRTGKAVVNCPG